MGKLGKNFQVFWTCLVHYVNISNFFLCWIVFNEIFPDSSKPAGNDVIGIDLGTTNSCVAVMEGKVRLFISSY